MEDSEIQNKSKVEKGSNTTMIQLQIEKESDLYNPYDPSQTMINEWVYRYLKSFCTPLEVSKHTHDTLQIITDSPIDVERFQNVLHDAVNRDIAEFDRQITRNDKRFIWELIFGITFTVLSIGLGIYLDKMLLTMISLLGTMGIRDAIKIKTTVNHDIIFLKKLLDPISNIKIEVVRRS